MITNEEAIQILASMAIEKKVSPDDRIKEDIEALEMGVSALKKADKKDKIIDVLINTIINHNIEDCCDELSDDPNEDKKCEEICDWNCPQKECWLRWAKMKAKGE